MRRALLVGAAFVLSAAPLQAQRGRRSSGSHKGIPCGHSYISADKVCHIASSPDSSTSGPTSSDSAYMRSLRSPASMNTVTPAVARPSDPADIDAIRRERDSLRIVVATLKQVCTGHP